MSEWIFSYRKATEKKKDNDPLASRKAFFSVADLRALFGYGCNRRWRLFKFCTKKTWFGNIISRACVWIHGVAGVTIVKCCETTTRSSIILQRGCY